MPLNKTLDHRNKRGGERKEERERGEEDRWAKRKDHRYIKETKINGGKEVECFARNLQRLLSWFNEGNKDKESKPNVKKRDEEA